MAYAIAPWETRLLARFQATLSCDTLDRWMPRITKLGNGGAVWIATAGVLLCSKSHRRTGATLGLGLASGSILCNLLLKKGIARSRPCWRPDAPPLLIRMPRDYSFPSGHTMSSFIAATILTQADGRLGIPAYGLALLIGLSRLYLQVHYPTDILAGMGLGIAVGTTCSTLAKRPVNS